MNDRCIEERHQMGLTLPLIIMLNLALAYHSKVVDRDEDHDPESITVALQKAIKLYELAYQLHLDILTHHHREEEEERLGSTKVEDESDQARSQAFSTLRLTIIVSNNLATIHKFVGNRAKHRTCVQHLLSVVMYYTTIILPQHRQQSNNDGSGSDHQVSATATENVLSTTEFDGILRNVSSIVLRDVSASAA